MSYEMQPYSPRPIAEMGAVPIPFGLSLTQLALLGGVGLLVYKYVIKPKRRKNPRRRRNPDGWVKSWSPPPPTPMGSLYKPPGGKKSTKSKRKSSSPKRRKAVASSKPTRKRLPARTRSSSVDPGLAAAVATAKAAGASAAARTPTHWGVDGWVWLSTSDKQLAKAFGVTRKWGRGRGYQWIHGGRGTLEQREASADAMIRSLERAGYKLYSFTNID